ncbi:ATP-binding cassette domain-containing protein [Saccharopolyspora sp. WRP15-2]|uniref:ATP-binding cassette domain-containing protein n=1 Tax=Saccharopolyspora oryzae TaxID=2997343 RepID=A0ABT4UWP4_9PSEU|nr:ATP-binding cassette domain-containing protein [Saccharopolyspora oryzae]MDA3625554.1 ATP-binding cassette domain-containing protein [Saccharopolyspora oryzae]
MSADLVVEDLDVSYGRATAVAGVSLTAPAGSVTALVGPNGAGKSSLLLAISGAVAAKGRILVGGIDVAAMPARERTQAGIALVPQGRQLFPRISVVDNLRVFAEHLRLPRSAVDSALDRFPVLRERADRLAGVLSGGEQQMLAVSRALLGEPELLLLDEMATGLAPAVVQRLAETAVALARSGVAVLLAAPELGMQRRIVDRGYVLVRGQIVSEETGAALEDAYRRSLGIGAGS